MIDIIKAEEEFKKYVEPYDVTNGKIELKIAHTYRTINVAKTIAESLNLPKEEIELASLIGLLHDIGRFEQVRIYNTFNDKESIDHADFGVKLLFEDGLIRRFIEDDKYDNIIYKSIKNHNKYMIEDDLNEKELLHTKIIRDADKTDILAGFLRDIEEHRNVLYNYQEIAKQKVTEEVMQEFLEHKSIHKTKCKKQIDNFITVLSFIYDYNFNKGLEIIKENHYLERMIAQIETCEENKEQNELIKCTILGFLEEALKNN